MENPSAKHFGPGKEIQNLAATGVGADCPVPFFIEERTRLGNETCKANTSAIAASSIGLNHRCDIVDWNGQENVRFPCSHKSEQWISLPNTHDPKHEMIDANKNKPLFIKNALP